MLGWEALALIYYARNEYGTGPSHNPQHLVQFLNSGNTDISYECPLCDIAVVRGPGQIHREFRLHQVGSLCPESNGTVVFSVAASQQTDKSVAITVDSPILLSLIERIFAHELAGMDA